MKRFVEISDWRELWHRKLSPQAKHLRRYLWDNCDCAGVISLDFEAITFHVGEAIKEKHLAELGDWVEHLPGSRILIPSFIHFQNGDISPDCRAHTPIFKAIQAHNLVRSGILYHGSPDSLSAITPIPTDTLQVQVQGKGIVQETVQGKETDNRTLRLNALFNRRAETLWSDGETRAFRKNGAQSCPAEDFDLIEAYYRSGARYLRHDLQTLLNNWNGEIDRARKWKENPNETRQRNHPHGHRSITGAEQRQLGIPERPTETSLSDLLAKRDAAAKQVAAKPPEANGDQSGSSSHG